MTVLTKSLTENWTELLFCIEEKCSATEFQNWIAPLRLTSSSDDSITLEVPNIFVQEYFLANYKREIQTFLGTATLHFVIAEEKVTEAPRQAPVKEEAPIEEKGSFKLNPLYRFETFIEGPSNQFVRSAAIGVAMRPGKTYNPLFIHGGVGLGKTHLLHAIGHHIKENHKKLRIQCITTEGLINDIVDHLKNKSMDRLKKHYRTLDVLLVDDIQFLQSRLNFEEEFCNTFESLINQNQQIVITSDKPPSQLKLSERMIARMEWGLVAQVTPPDLETRVAILQHKAELRGLRLPHKVAILIADHIFNNVRQLEGAINRLTAYSKFDGKELTEEVVHDTLGEFMQAIPKKGVSVDTILKCVSSVFEVRLSDLRSSSRAKEIAFPRQVAMYLAKELIKESLAKLASAFGGKTHSTLLHAWKKIHDQMERDEALRQQVQAARKNLAQ